MRTRVLRACVVAILGHTLHGVAAAGPKDNIVIYAADVPTSNVHGLWSATTDAASPGRVKLSTPYTGWSTPNAPIATPTDYFDVSFNATANTSYTIWIRLQATNNCTCSDSVSV